MHGATLEMLAFLSSLSSFRPYFKHQMQICMRLCATFKLLAHGFLHWNSLEIQRTCMFCVLMALSPAH